MRLNQLTKLGITFLMFAVMGVPVFGETGGNKTSSKSHGSHYRLHRSAWKRHGQQQISSDRTREIQEALIRERYLDGKPSGVWDARTLAAMRKFQTDQGWQSKVVPDSRALIKLGLGPNHENDLNPDLMGDRSFSPLRGAEPLSGDIPQR